MPFPPTPSITPSNTPTPSVTASQTPTHTPTQTSCPNTEVIYTQVYLCDGDEGSLVDYDISITINGEDTYQFQPYIPSPYLQDQCINTLPYPVEGYTYSFQVNLPSGLVPCEVNIPAFNKVEFTVGEFLGSYYDTGDLTWTGQTSYYLNDVLVWSADTDIDTVSYFVPGTVEPYNGCEFTLFFTEMVIGPQFPVRKSSVTPTPTPTNTATPNPTSTQTPTPNPTSTQTPTPNPTQTATQQVTPTQTPTPSTTQPPTILCYSYEIVPNFGQEIEWLNCDGSFNSATVSGGVPYYIDCAQQGTVSGSGVINQGLECT
jgi:hypothetical protein